MAKETKVVVDLGAIEIPPPIKKQLEADIRTAVLRAVAQIDLKGDSVIFPGRFPGGTIGIILRPSKHPIE